MTGRYKTRWAEDMAAARGSYKDSWKEILKSQALFVAGDYPGAWKAIFRANAEREWAEIFLRYARSRKLNRKSKNYDALKKKIEELEPAITIVKYALRDKALC